MRVLVINEVCGHTSTGKISAEIAERYSAQGHEVKIAYGRDAFVPEKYRKFAVRIGNDFDVWIHAVRTRLFDTHGFGSTGATSRFLEWAEEYRPQLVWLHNLHGYYINIERLFAWIKKHPEMEIIWTLHDCWAFTGHCAYFSYAGCDKWKTYCHSCCQKYRYPKSLLVDNSKRNFEKKRAAFSGVNNLKIKTPSNWLAELVKQSFLREYEVEVEYNTVDAEVFRPTKSNFRERYAIGSKRMLLGVANVWEERKGLRDFVELSKMLSDEYVIVLVGVDDKQIKKLPGNVIGIKRTRDQKELAGIYSAADLYVCPSREETFGLTILEAKLCGTEAIVLAGTACEEVARKYGGIVVPAGDIDALYSAIVGYSYK